MRIPARVHNDSILSESILVQGVDEDAFMIGLDVGDIYVWIFKPEFFQVVLKSCITIDLWLSLSEQIEVGAVKYKNIFQ